MDNPKISLENASQNTILAVVNSIRQQISNTFNEYLPQDLSGLMLGIVIGVKANLSNEFSNNLKLSGVTHVIAASGMNVTMIAGFFFYTFALFLKRKTAIFLSIFAIIFYACLSGFAPSIIRASIMGIILFSSQGLGRQSYSFYSLILTGLLMLFIWPWFIVDVGFLLSFVSTLGILFIPLAFGKARSILSEDFLITLSSQIATLPILLATFGTYSLWSIFVNLLVLWTIPPLMILGGVAALLSLVFAPLAKYILLLALPLLTYFSEVINYFAKLSGVVTIDSIPRSLIVGYYILLVSILMFAFKKQKESVDH